MVVEKEVVEVEDGAVDEKECKECKEDVGKKGRDDTNEDAASSVDMLLFLRPFLGTLEPALLLEMECDLCLAFGRGGWDRWEECAWSPNVMTTWPLSPTTRFIFLLILFQRFLMWF